MKISQWLFRAGLSLSVAFIVSFSATTLLFNFSKYETNIDRAFLVAVPTLALAYLLFELFPIFWEWIQHRQANVLVAFGALALIGAAAVVLPFAIAPVSYLGVGAFALILYALMASAAPFAERILSIRYYALGFLLSLVFVYGTVGFLDDALKSSFNVVWFTMALTLVCAVAGYYLVRRAAHSLQSGFLHAPLNIVLCLTLPALLSALIFASAQFPAMFVWEYITIPKNLSGAFFASAMVAGAWGTAALERFESRGVYQRFRQTKIFAFIQENLPGLYAGGMFFLINLIIARALNHPAFSINSVVFETDAGPWMSILGSPESDAINRSVHPLVLITARPLIRLVGIFMGENWNLAAMLVVAALSGSCVLMAWIFVKRAIGEKTYAFIFAILLGSTATHLLFGSLTETYVFGMTSLIFFFLLVQAKEKRFSVLVPVGVIVFGITVTNVAQSAIGLFCNKFGFWRTVRYCALVVSAGVALTVLTSALYPNAITFFFVPADLSFETNFIKPVYASPAEQLREKIQVVSRAMFLYEVVAPSPLEVISQKPADPYPTIDLKTFDWRTHKLASYKDFANVPLALWLILLAGAFALFVKNFRATPHLPLMIGLLGNLAFNFLLHANYGVELFLYTPFWAYALIFFIALAYANLADKKWFQSLLVVFLLILMVNNVWFIFGVLRALAPFFAAS